MWPPPKKKTLATKKFQKIIFSQFQFRLKIKKIDLKNFQKICPPPKKISKNYFFSILISPKNKKKLT